MPQENVVHDPLVLRAIAHPVRTRILNELDAQGSLRAADIARELGIPANQASFHLRSLAKYGLVVEDAAAARDKRDRVWKIAHEGGLRVNLGELEAAEGGVAASRVYRRHAASWAHLVVEDAYSDDRHPDEHRSVDDTSLRLTRDEARALSAELTALVQTWADRTRGPAGGGDERATYEYLGILLPRPSQPERGDA